MTSGDQTAVLRDFRGAWTYVRTRGRCEVRSLLADGRRLLATAVVLLIVAVGLPLALRGPVEDYGRLLASGQPAVGLTGGILASVGAAGLLLGSATGSNRADTGTATPLVRASLPLRALALGRLGAQLGLGLALLGACVLVALAEVSLAAGGLLAPTVLLAATLPVLLASFGAGWLAGAPVRVAIRRLDLSPWTKAVAYVVLVVGSYGGTQYLLPSLEGEASPGPALSGAVLPGEPLQAYASVALAPLGAPPRPLGAVVAGVVLGAIPLLFGIAVRTETRLLDVARESETTTETLAVRTSRRVPRPFAWTPSGRVAWRYLLRARRDPRLLAHLTSLLVLVVSVGAGFLATADLSRGYVGPAAVVGGAVIAGAAFCLNPLGDERLQRPVLSTSTPSSGVLLRGRALAGLALGVPLALAFAVPVELLEGSVSSVLTLSAFGVFLALLAPGTALGIGAAVPRFEPREYAGVERAHPSMIVLYGYTFGGVAVGIAGLLLFAYTLEGALSTRDAVVYWTAYLAVVGLPAVSGYVYAVRRFEGLSLDET